MKWIVYKGSDSFEGPMTPEEIRDGLREGTLDPFDFVAKEGSAIKLQLIEVDEIFDVSGSPSALSTGELDDLYVVEDSKEVSTKADLLAAPPKEQEREPILGRGQLHLAAQIEQVETSSVPPSTPREIVVPLKPKELKRHYYLILHRQSGRKGPFTASEITQLFRGKTIPKKARVLRLGEQQQQLGEVPLERFLRLFRTSVSHDRSVPQRVHHRVNRPTSVLANQARQGERVARDRAFLLMLISLVMFIAAGLIIGVSTLDRSPPRKTTPTERRSLAKKSGPDNVSRPEDQSVGPPRFAAREDRLRLGQRPQDSNSRMLAERAEKAQRERTERAQREREERERVERAERERAARVERERAERVERERAERVERERAERAERERAERAERVERERAERAERERAERAERVERERVERAERERAERAERERAERIARERAERAERERAEKEERARRKKLQEEMRLAQVRAANARQESARRSLPNPSPSGAVSPSVESPASPPRQKSDVPQSKGSSVALIDGALASQYGPLTCNKGLVSSCDGSCAVTCSGPQGPVTIMFFKGVWGSKIEAKSSSIYVSGLVRIDGQGPPRIIVNDVQ